MGAPTTAPAPRPTASLHGPRRLAGALLGLALATLALEACRKPEEAEPAPIAAPSERVKAPPLPETIHEVWKGPSFDSSAAPAASKAAPKTSVLRAGSVVLEPGQHAYIEAKITAGRVTLVREVESASAAPLVLDLTLRETDTGVSLAVQNPFAQWLSYRAAPTIPGKVAPARVACTIGPGLWAPEVWTDKVSKLSISGFTLADQPAACAR